MFSQELDMVGDVDFIIYLLIYFYFFFIVK